MTENIVHCFEKPPPFSPSPCLPFLLTIFYCSVQKFFILSRSTWSPIFSLFHFTCDLGENLCVSLASFKLGLNIVLSPELNQLEGLFITPEYCHSISLVGSTEIFASSSEKKWVWSRRSCDKPYDYGTRKI